MQNIYPKFFVANILLLISFIKVFIIVGLLLTSLTSQTYNLAATTMLKEIDFYK